MTEFYNELDKLFQSGDLRAVESYIIRATERAEREEDDFMLAAYLNELACFYRGISKFSESERAFERTLSIFDRLSMGGTEQYATVLLNYAGLKRLTGQIRQAIEMFLKSKEMILVAEQRESYTYAGVLNNLALCYQETSEFELAKQNAGEALTIMQKLGQMDEEVATSLCNLSAIEMKLGNHDEAERLVKSALEMFEAMCEPSAHHAAALATYATVLCRKGEYEEALSGFSKALKLIAKFFGENIEYARCCVNLSAVYELVGDSHAALSMAERASEIMTRILGVASDDVKKLRGEVERLRGKAEPQV